MNDVWINNASQNNKRHLSFIESQHYCALCGASLEIKVFSQRHLDTLKEEAHCNSCKIKARIKDHKIQ